MKKKNKKNVLTAILIALIVLSIAAILYVIMFHKEELVAVKEQPVKKNQLSEPKAAPKPRVVQERPVPVKETREKESVKEKNKDKPPAQSVVAKPPEKEKTVIAKIIPPAVPSKYVAIIIDDIGYDMKPLHELLNIDAQITFAVLPLLSHSHEAAEAAHKANREILLHLPMEPRSYPKEKPGVGALFTDMSDEEVVIQLEKNLSSVPYVTGVNNHMGSKFMSDEEKLTIVFEQLKKRNLFFIDSRTTNDSKAMAASQKVHLTIASRRIFLDNERDYSKIYQILMDVALTPAGRAPLIVIGHPYPETIRALRDAIKVFREKGIMIIPVSQLMKKSTAQGAS
jgi:uncharacterized protein